MDDDHSSTDGRISTLFHDTAAEIEPDVRGLVRGGIDRGRVKRRWRTIGTAFAAAAAVGVVGVAVSVVPSVRPGASGVGAAGASATSTTARSDATEPKPKPTRQPTASTPDIKPTGIPPTAIPTADIPAKAPDLPRQFTALYPGKVTAAEKRTGRIINDGRAGQIAHFRWNGFMTSFGFTAYSGTPTQGCGELQRGRGQSDGPTETCLTRPDGTVLSRGRSVVPHDGGGVSVNNHAFLFTEDGYLIFVISYNWASKTGPIRSEEPPFSIAQLTRVVTSDRWS